MASELHLGDSNWKIFQVGYPVDIHTPVETSRRWSRHVKQMRTHGLNTETSSGFISIYKHQYTQTDISGGIVIDIVVDKNI